MSPIKTFVSEHLAANLLHQVRWRDGFYCPYSMPNPYFGTAAIEFSTDTAVKIAIVRSTIKQARSSSTQ